MFVILGSTFLSTLCSVFFFFYIIIILGRVRGMSRRGVRHVRNRAIKSAWKKVHG